MTPTEIIHAVVAEVEAAGIPVAFVPGWETRGRPRPFAPVMAIFHHTGIEEPHHEFDYPSLATVRDGRSDLAGPLAHFGIGRHTGTIFVIAAGNANHAGEGGFRGFSSNGDSWGIEEENDGVGEPWGPEICRSAVLLGAALARHTGFGADMIIDHREWAPGRKPDRKGIDSDQFRADVDAVLAGAPFNQEDFLMSLTPEQQADLFEMVRATTAAMERMEIAVRDKDTGLKHQVDELRAKVDQLLARP